MSWLLNTATHDDTVLVLGRSEGFYRAILNPAILLLGIVTVVLLRRERRGGSRSGAMGAALLLLGLIAMLTGNVVEFGLDGTLGDNKDAGFAILLGAYLVLVPLGGILLNRGHALRAVPPARMGAALLAGTPLALVGPIAAHMLFGLAWATIGVGMVRRGSQHPALASTA